MKKIIINLLRTKSCRRMVANILLTDKTMYSVGWKVHLEKCKKEHPFKYVYIYGIYVFFRTLTTINRIYTDFKYSFKSKYVYKWFIVDTGLEKTAYHDIDERIRGAVFSLFLEFVDKECAAFYLSYSEDPKECSGEKFINERASDGDEDYKKMVKIYNYIKKERPELVNRYLFNDQELYDKDDEILKDIMSVRKVLWT